MCRVKLSHHVVQLGRLWVAHYGRRWRYIHGRLLTLCLTKTKLMSWSDCCCPLQRALLQSAVALAPRGLPAAHVRI